MNWNVEKTTHNERVLIATAMDGIFVEAEQAEALLDLIIMEYFDESPQRSLSANTAEQIGRLIYLARNLLCNINAEYQLTICPSWESFVGHFTDTADKIKNAWICEKKMDELEKKERGLSNKEMRAALQKARIAAGALDDAAAIAAIDDLL